MEKPPPWQCGVGRVAPLRRNFGGFICLFSVTFSSFCILPLSDPLSDRHYDGFLRPHEQPSPVIASVEGPPSANIFGGPPTPSVEMSVHTPRWLRMTSDHSREGR